jgi:L-threonylcarbamoyladenylate synthase
MRESRTIRNAAIFGPNTAVLSKGGYIKIAGAAVGRWAAGGPNGGRDWRKIFVIFIIVRSQRKLRMILVKSDEPNSVALAAEAVRRGELVIYPTDTIYGLGGDARNSVVVRRIEDLKGRDGRPISIVVSDLEMASRYCVVSPCARRFAQLLPGPYTFVLARRRGMPGEEVAHNAAGDSIGVRIPDHPFAVALVRELGFPITSTSVNFSGQSAAAELGEMQEELKSAASLIVDAGRCRHGEASTVIDMRGDRPVVLRSGAGNARFQELQKSVL